MVTHTFSLSTQEAEAGRPGEFEASLVHRGSSRPGLHRKTSSQKQNKTKQPPPPKLKTKQNPNKKTQTQTVLNKVSKLSSLQTP